MTRGDARATDRSPSCVVTAGDSRSNCGIRRRSARQRRNGRYELRPRSIDNLAVGRRYTGNAVGGRRAVPVPAALRVVVAKRNVSSRARPVCYKSGNGTDDMRGATAA
jgi:hypothetical protein